ncbi:MAG: restriction endonuclease subunit S [Spiribacter salinus]|uniref:Restriction endonuclease subunit S n=1 Tax=Spiribacter salinus TaxID=1335746 RepID=A0A540VSE1_9GAMM|nr:MAG: restriction endonuclease subunit S [Spiribacter salinus]
MAKFRGWARLLPKHTVCLSRTASVGYVIVMGRPMATSQDFVNWICDPDALDYRYLKYVLLAEKNAFSRFAHGTTHQTIYFPEVKAFHVCAPDVDGQRAIADVLSALDDKIEQNRRTARALERLARAIFRAWFVDFEPVKAKAAGATAFPSMPHEVFDALPTRFVDSEIGPIPEGWEVKEFGDIAAQVRLSAKPDEIDPETPYIGLEHMPRRNFALSEWEAVSKVKSNKSRFREGQFLFGKLRPYFHKVGVAPIDGVSSTDIIVLEPRIESLFGPALGLITSDAFVDHATACSSGTKMPRTNWKDMSSFRLAIGPPEIMAAHTALIKPFVDSVVAGIHESHRLAEMRDYLLPKLLSGRVHVDVTEEPRMETT